MKRRSLRTLLAAVMLAVSLVPAASAATVPAGSGTESDPFRITSQEELEIIFDFPSAHYVLMNDITLDSNWQPLTGSGTLYVRREDIDLTEADFQGVLDGNGYTIDLSNVPAPRQTLIRANFGTIRNLRLVGGYDAYGDYYEDWAGGLATDQNWGLVENCSAEGTFRVTTDGSYRVHPTIGGLVGTNYDTGVIQNCYGIVDIMATLGSGSGGGANLGAVLGENYYGTIINCYGVVTNGYSTYQGDADLSGGVCGTQRSDSVSSGCYYDRDVQGHSARSDGTRHIGKSTTAMKMQISYTDWDFNNVWYIDPALNNGYPVLRVDQRFDIPAGAPSAGSDSSSQGGETTITDSSGQIEITFGDNSSSTSAPSTPSGGGIKVTVNGQYLTFDQPPVAVNGRTLVPMRAIFEALGATVEWIPENQTIYGYRASDERAILLELDVPVMARQVGGGDIYLIDLDVAPTAMNNRTLVPVRAIAEAFNCTVDWDQTTQTVIITG